MKRFLFAFLALVSFAAQASAHVLPIPFAHVGSLDDVIEARFPRGAFSVTGFNGGKIQAQSAFLYATGDYPYINYMKKAQDWTYTSFAFGGVKPSELDSLGYPTTLATSQFYTVLPKPSQASIGNPNWVLRWTGDSTLFIQGGTGGSITTVSGSTTGSGGVGYYEFSTTENSQFRVGISNLNGSTVGAIELYRKDQESLRNVGEIFNPDHINILRNSKIGVLRFLDYQYGNTSSVTAYATRKPVGYFSYAASEYRSSLYLTTTGYTANTGTDYTATGNGTGVPSSGAPTHNMTIHWLAPVNNVTQSSSVTFTDGTSDLNWTAHPLVNGDLVQFSFFDYAGIFTDGNFFKPTETLYVVNKATNTFQLSRTPGGTALVFQNHPGGTAFVTRPPTLNLNGSGKVIIADFQGQGVANDSIKNTNYLTLVYDDFLKVWMIPAFKDNYAVPMGIVDGMPVEDMVAMCAKVGAHPHFVTPVYSLSSTSGDWATGISTYIKNSGPDWMVPRYETPNEVFNTYSGFIQGSYMRNLSRVLWNTGFDTNNITGRYARSLGQKVAAVYGGGLGTKFNILIGVQSSTAINGPTSFRSAVYLSDGSNPRLTTEFADGYKNVNINASNPTITMLAGGVHGKSIGDPVFFAPNGGNNLPSNMSPSTKYWVANNANFSTTGFDITTVSGGGSSGQAGISPGTGGNAPYTMYAATQPVSSSVISRIVFTSYIDPIALNSISESTDAINYYVNDNSGQKIARIATYVNNNTNTSALITGYISGTTLHVLSVQQGDLLRMDAAIVGTGVTADTYLTAKIATAGGDVATFTVNNSQTVASSGAPISMRFAPLRNYYQAWAKWGRDLASNPVLGVAAYEGGWSPQYAATGSVTGNLNSVITDISKASSAVLTLSDTNVFNSFVSGANPAVVNGYIWLNNLTGGYATYNERIVQITNVLGNQVTVNMDTTAQASAYTGGTALAAYFMILAGTATASITGTTLNVTSGTLPRQFDYVSYGSNKSAQISENQGNGVYQLYGSPTASGNVTMNVYTASVNFINDWRKASKDVPAVKDIVKTNADDIYAVSGGEFPSVYFFAGGSAWGVWDPDIYAAPQTPYGWQGIQQYPFLLKRDIDPASNDNDPMWLEKAA